MKDRECTRGCARLSQKTGAGRSTALKQARQLKGAVIVLIVLVVMVLVFADDGGGKARVDTDDSPTKVTDLAAHQQPNLQATKQPTKQRSSETTNPTGIVFKDGHSAVLW